MPKLIDNIEGVIIAKTTIALNSENTLVTSINSTFGYTNWFSIGDSEYYLLDFKKINEIVDISKTKNYGLGINRNKTFNDINISY